MHFIRERQRNLYQGMPTRPKPPSSEKAHPQRTTKESTLYSFDLCTRVRHTWNDTFIATPYTIGCRHIMGDGAVKNEHKPEDGEKKM